MELLSPLELSTGLQSKTINKILLCINKTIELQNKTKITVRTFHSHKGISAQKLHSSFETWKSEILNYFSRDFSMTPYYSETNQSYTKILKFKSQWDRICIRLVIDS